MLERIRNLIHGQQKVTWNLFVVTLAIVTLLGLAFTLVADTQSAGTEAYDPYAAYAEQYRPAQSPSGPTLHRETYDPYAAYAEQYRPVVVKARTTIQNGYDPYTAYAERYRPAQSQFGQTLHKDAYDPYAAYAEQYRPATGEERATKENAYDPYAAYAERYRPAAGLEVQTSAR